MELLQSHVCLRACAVVNL